MYWVCGGEFCNTVLACCWQMHGQHWTYVKQLSDSVLNLYKPFSDFRLSAPLVHIFLINLFITFLVGFVVVVTPRSELTNPWRTYILSPRWRDSSSVRWFFNPSVSFRIKIPAFIVQVKIRKEPNICLNDAFEDFNGVEGEIFSKGDQSIQIVTIHLNRNSCFRAKNIHWSIWVKPTGPFPSP